MSPRPLLAAGLALVLAGCTLSDQRTEPTFLPEGLLFGGAALEFELRAARGARATVYVDGAEVGDVQVNAPESIDVSRLAVGRHTLRAKVHEGPYAVETGVRDFEVERTPPRLTASPAPSELAVPGTFQVALSFDEPIRVAALLEASFFADDQGRTLPTTLSADPDGLHATATLGIPLWARSGVRLVVSPVDRAGNTADLSTLPPLRWSAPVTPVEVTVPEYVGDRLEATLAFPAGYTGPTGPLVVLLCTSDPRGVLSRLEACPSVEIADASQAAAIDTSAIPTSYRWIAALLPGHRPSAARMTRVHPGVLVTIQPLRSLTNGPVDVTFSATGELPDSMELLAAGEVVGTLVRSGPPSGFSTASTTVTWPAAVPDGVYTLGVRGPTAWGLDRFTAQVTVDRTPPAITIEVAAEQDARQAGEARLSAPEPFTGTVTYLVDGQPFRTWPLGLAATTATVPANGPPSPAWLDATLAIDVTGLVDAAGNHAVGAVPAGRFPVWLSPAGPGPLETGGAPILARDAVATPPRFLGVAQDLRIALVDQAGDVLAGRLATLPATPHGEPGASTSALVCTGNAINPLVAWREVSAAGTRIRQLQFEDDGVVPLAPLVAAAGASAARLSQGDTSLAWTEPADGGARSVGLVAPGFDGGTRPTAGLPTTALDAVDDCCVDRADGSYRLLAWLDGGGPVPQLALSASRRDFTGAGDGPWSLLAGSLNADAAQPAADPVVLGTRVAWAEGQTIRAARVDAAGTGVEPQDPVAAPGARWPRFVPRFLDFNDPGAPPLLLFVEPGPAGDVIAARRFVAGTGWAEIPPVNAGVPGEVRSLAVSAQHVTWTDAAGHVFVRRLNR
jgi:hypothetical protein